MGFVGQTDLEQRFKDHVDTLVDSQVTLHVNCPLDRVAGIDLAIYFPMYFQPLEAFVTNFMSSHSETAPIPHAGVFLTVTIYHVCMASVFLMTGLLSAGLLSSGFGAATGRM